VERQVEVRGPDATRLIQMLTPRDLRGLTPGRCAYTPMVEQTGGMLNDPVTLKLAEDRYWISIADSDLLLWVKGISWALNLTVDVTEPDVSPLAIQGPKAETLMARVFGEDVTRLGFFRFSEFDFQGRNLVIARSGYSKQGGFEIYCEGSDLGEPLWDACMEAGRDLDVHAGCPNMIERIEGGLLSYGSDMTRRNTPFECGLGRFCNTMNAIGCVGRDALIRAEQDGAARQIRSVSIDGPKVPPVERPWQIYEGDLRVGQVTSAAWSPDFDTNVGLAMIDMSHWAPGTRLTVDCPDEARTLMVRESSFI
ncbi:MAG: dimethylsulfoniopropionate demethylase, partial [Pseudomonadota bacterium]